MTKHIRITMVKSSIGRKPKHIEIIKQLGLKKLNSTVIHHDNPSIRGLVKVVNYMLKIEDAT